MVWLEGGAQSELPLNLDDEAPDALPRKFKLGNLVHTRPAIQYEML